MVHSIDIQHWAAKGLGTLTQDENGQWWIDWYGRNIEVKPSDGLLITSEDVVRACCDRNGFRPPRVVYLEEG